MSDRSVRTYNQNSKRRIQNEMTQAMGFVPFDELSAYEKIGKVLTNHHFHVSKSGRYGTVRPEMKTLDSFS